MVTVCSVVKQLRFIGLSNVNAETRANRAKFIAMWRAGKLTREIMAEFQVKSAAAVLDWAKKLGLPKHVDTWYGEGFGYCMSHLRQDATLMCNRAGQPMCPVCHRALRLRSRKHKGKHLKASQT